MDNRQLRDILYTLVTSNDWLPLDMNLFMFETAMIIIATVVATQLLVRKKVSGWTVIVALFMGFGINNNLYAFEELLAKAWLPLWPRLGMANPVTHRYLLLAMVTIPLIVLACRRATRSLDRVIWSASCGMVLITVTLCHLLYVHGVMMTTVITEAHRLENLANSTSDAAFDEICQALNTLYCERGVFHQDQSLTPPNPKIKRVVQEAVAAKLMESQNGKASITFYTGNFAVDGPVAFHFVLHDGQYRLILNRDGLQPIYRQSLLNFDNNIALAHFIWVLGGLGILGFHKTAWKRRLVSAS
jgi:hypothetical protein